MNEITYVDASWLVLVLNSVFDESRAVPSAIAFVTVVALLAGWARRPANMEFWAFCLNAESWNLGLPWTQTAVISMFTTAAQFVAALKVPKEGMKLIELSASELLTVRWESHPGLPPSMIAATFFLLLVGVNLAQIAVLAKSRDCRLQLAVAADRAVRIQTTMHQWGWTVLALVLGGLSAWAAWKLPIWLQLVQLTIR